MNSSIRSALHRSVALAFAAAALAGTAVPAAAWEPTKTV